MCTVYSTACTCFRNQQEHDEERARQARASRLEHDVLDVLHGVTQHEAGTLAHCLAHLVRSRLDDGAHVADILVTGSAGVFFWTNDGAQHFARLDSHAAIRLAA
jgi:hypothetical protein